ncbi:MAG: extracellular solute-binding protein [Chloroflexota bacterium]
MPRNICLCLLALLMVLTGCVPEASVPPPNPSPADAPTTEPIDGPVVITFGVPGQAIPTYVPMVEAFNREQATIQVQLVDTTDTIRPLLEDLSTSPDEVSRTLAGLADTYIGNGFSEEAEQDLRPFIEADPAFEPDDFWPGMLPETGPIRRLPQSTRVEVFEYNQELFQERGVAEPQSDWTWPDLRQALEQLAERDGNTITTYGMTVTDSSFELALRGELAEAGVAMDHQRDDQSANELLLPDDPAAVTVVENVTQLIRSGGLFTNQFNPDEIIDVQRLVEDQQVAIWPLFYTIPDRPWPFATNVVAFPQIPYPQISSGISNGGYVMSSGTQYPEAAWRWLSFLSRQPPQSQTGAFVPARRSVLEQEQVLEQLDPAVATAVEQALNQPQINPILPAGWIDSAIRDVIQNDVEPALAVEPAYAETQRIWEEVLQQPTPTPGPPIIVATPIPETVAEEGETVLRFMGSEDHNRTALEQAAQTFSQERPGLAVTIVGTEAEQLELAELAQTSDCFATNLFRPPQDLTALLDVRPFLDADTQLPTDAFPPLLLDLLTQDGRLLGLPYTADAPVLVANTTLVDAPSWPPTPDWTMTDLQQAAAQLSQGSNDDRIYGFAFSPLLFVEGQELLFQQARQPVFDPASGQPQFTDPALVNVLDEVVALLAESAPYEQLSGSTIDILDRTDSLLRTERLAMWLDTIEGIEEYTSFYVDEETIDVQPFPFDLGDGGQPTRIRGLHISAETEYADGCWEWISYLSGVDTVVPPGIPARQSVVDSPAFQAQSPAWLISTAEAYHTHWQASQAMPGWWQTRSPQEQEPYWFYQALDAGLQGGNLEQELAEAQTTTAQYWDCVQNDGEPGECAQQADPDYDGRWQIDESE